MCHVSCVMCHVSCVKCHVSCVMCRVSHSPESRVIVRGMGLSAGLHHVTVALVLSMLKHQMMTSNCVSCATRHLAPELIPPVHLLGVRITVRHKVDVDILANEFMHRRHLLDYEAAETISVRINKNSQYWIISSLGMQSHIISCDAKVHEPELWFRLGYTPS